MRRIIKNFIKNIKTYDQFYDRENSIEFNQIIIVVLSFVAFLSFLGLFFVSVLVKEYNKETLSAIITLAIFGIYGFIGLIKFKNKSIIIIYNYFFWVFCFFVFYFYSFYFDTGRIGIGIYGLFLVTPILFRSKIKTKYLLYFSLFILYLILVFIFKRNEFFEEAGSLLIVVALATSIDMVQKVISFDVFSKKRELLIEHQYLDYNSNKLTQSIKVNEICNQIMEEILYSKNKNLDIRMILKDIIKSNAIVYSSDISFLFNINGDDISIDYLYTEFSSGNLLHQKTSYKKALIREYINGFNKDSIFFKESLNSLSSKNMGLYGMFKSNEIKSAIFSPIFVDKELSSILVIGNPKYIEYLDIENDLLKSSTLISNVLELKKAKV